jgi:hypothetical protein
LYSLLANVDAVDRARLGALIASNARRQIVTVKAAISRRNRDRQFGILEMMRKRLALWIVRAHPVAKGDVHSVSHGKDSAEHVAKPFSHEQFTFRRAIKRKLMLNG